MKSLQTKRLPIEESWELEVRLDAADKATVILKSGAAHPLVRPLLGEHPL